MMITRTVAAGRRQWSRLTGAVILFAFTTGAASAEPNWPRWRGPRGDGHSPVTNLPLNWSAESIAWKVPLKGSGQSSPIIWGDRIFLTSALDNGRQRIVACFDTQDGSALWEHVAWTGEPEKIHQMNSWASATCATDGEVVVASFGSPADSGSPAALRRPVARG